MNDNFLKLAHEIKELTSHYPNEIVTLMKNDISISATCIKPPLGVEEAEDFLAKAILVLIKDGWTAIPF